MDLIHPPGGPKPRGPYSPAVRAGDFIFVSGQGPIELGTDQLSKGDIRQQTLLVLTNIQHILTAAGARVSDIVKCSVFLADAKDFEAMNEVYAAFFGAHAPARTTVEAKFVAKMKVEIDCVAYCPAKEQSRRPPIAPGR